MIPQTVAEWHARQDFKLWQGYSKVRAEWAQYLNA